MMTETELRAWLWRSCTSRIIAMIEEYSEGWLPNGPPAVTAQAIVAKIRDMPVPGPNPTSAPGVDDDTWIPPYARTRPRLARANKITDERAVQADARKHFDVV